MTYSGKTKLVIFFKQVFIHEQQKKNKTHTYNGEFDPGSG